MIIKTILPGNVKKYFNDNTTNNVVKKSNSTFYHLIGAPEATWSVTYQGQGGSPYFPIGSTYVPNTKKVLNFRLAVTTYNGLTSIDCKFNFDNINFSNNLNVTSANLWQKSTDYNIIRNSIESMFLNTGVYDSWDISWINSFEIPSYSTGYRYVRFSLTRKTEGDYILKSNMVKVESLINNIYLNSDIIIKSTPNYPNYIKSYVNGASASILENELDTFFDFKGSTFNAMITENYSLGLNILDDLSYYEIGLDISRTKFQSNVFPVNPFSSNQYISSIAKRLTSFGDFEPLFIAKENLTNWKPVFNSFNFYISKYLESFNLKYFQSYIDPSIPNNSFKKKVYPINYGSDYGKSDPLSYDITLVDAYQDLFENYSSNDALTNDFNYQDDYYSELITSGYNIGNGFDNVVRVIATSSNGSYLIGGDFINYNTLSSPRIVKIKQDGSLDTSFINHFKFNNIISGVSVYSIVEQPDNKILIGGDFTQYSGTFSRYITRLNSDGSLDNTFINYGLTMSLNGRVNSIGLQTDGKILVGGNFTLFNGLSASHIIRLNSDGSKDNTFINNTGFDDNVNVIRVVGTSSIIVGGQFTKYKGLTANGIEALKNDGSKDTNIRFGNGFISGNIYDINASSLNLGGLIIPTSIIVGGTFDSYGGGFTFSGVNNEVINKPANHLAYLNFQQVTTNLSPFTQTSYNIPVLKNNFHNKLSSGDIVLSILKSPAGYLIGGYFNSYGGLNHPNIVKVNGQGDSDESFTSGSNQFINALSTNNSNQYVIGGYFTSYDNQLRNRISFTNLDGSDFKITSYIPRLLTNQPLAKKINKGYEVISCLSTKWFQFKNNINYLSPDQINIDYVYVDGTTHSYATYSATILNPIENNMFINTLTFNVDNLINDISPTQSIRYIDINFNLLDHATNQYVGGPTQRYIIDNISSDCGEDDGLTSIIFKNKEGGYDLFEFEAITQVKSNRSIDTYNRSYSFNDAVDSDFTSIYNIDYQKVYSTSTRILTDEEFEWLEELNKATNVYILKDDLKLYPIIATIDYSSTINTDKKINIEFTYSRPEATY